MSGPPGKGSAGTSTKVNTAQLQQMGKTLVGQLYMVLRTVRIHDSLNQTMLLATEHLKDTLNLVWTALGSVKLEFIEDQVYLNDARLRLDTQSADNVKELGGMFRARGLGGLTFKRPVTNEGIRALVGIFMDVVPGSADPAAQMREKLLELRDLAVEILGPRSFGQGKAPTQDVAIDPRLWALQTYAKAVMAIRRFVQDASGEEPARDGDPRLKITRIVQDLVDISYERANLLLKICTIKDATDYAYNHAVNVGILSIAIGRNLGMSRTNLVDLGLAGMFADLGLTQGMTEALEKSQLQEVDKEAIAQHTMHAVRLLIGHGALTRSSMRRIITAFQHHVHFDLKGGYPDHEKKRPLHLFSRIVAVADSYDALTTNRPWREAFPPAEALRILAQEAGTKFDPTVVRLLINLLGIWPVGIRVQLDNGEMAVVYHAPDNPENFDKPIVKITHDAEGRPVERGVVRDTSEQNPDGTYRYTIVAAQEELAPAT